VITLESDRARLTLDPAFGARVTTLWDKRSGREWLVTGPREGEASEAAQYGGPQARGWDECFPTVAACDHPAWGSMRDHGALWGRPWSVLAHGPVARTRFVDARFTVSREVALHGATVTIAYEVANDGSEALPWMWSQHCLLAPRAGERIVLDGFDGFTADGHPFDWPRHPARDLSIVGVASEGFALKAYARARGQVRAAVEGEAGGIAFAWDAASIPALGLWLDWGGWPEGDGVHQLALEPTTAPAGDLAGAEAMGAARLLPPGGTASWRMAITLTDPRADPA